jgi:hypothetical protein
MRANELVSSLQATAKNVGVQPSGDSIMRANELVSSLQAKEKAC